jgi:hypothetical protein
VAGEQEGIEMSDTPISDSTPHNVADLGMLCRRLERELNTANERISKLNDYIAALETLGDLIANELSYGYDVKMWNKAKEAKP